MIDKSILDYKYFRRSLAFYIDTFFITLFVFIYLLVFDKKGPTIECDKVLCWNSSRILIYQLLFYFIYFLLMEYFFSYTIGKQILGFSVYKEKEKNLFIRILIRTLIRLIPLNIIFFWFDKNHYFWHEKWTKCYTIKSPMKKI